MFGGIWIMAIATAAQPTYYVSPTGDDQSANGTLKKPFASIQRAVNAARGKGGTIVLRGGTYYLHSPLQFGPEDKNLTLQAYGKEKPVVSGGRELHARMATGLATAKLIPDQKFTSVFVNGRRAMRPRLPRGNFFHVADTLPPTDAAKGKGWDRFKFKPGDIKPEWAGSDAEVLCIHIWGMSRLHIKGVEGDVVTFAGPTGYDASWAEFAKGGRYLVEGAPGVDLAPDEWQIKGDELNCKLPEGDAGAKGLQIVVPVLPQLVLLDSAENITFKGLTFSHAGWVSPPQGHNFPQADADIPGAIQATHCTGLIFTDCEVSHVDTYGIDLGEGTQGCTVENCKLVDLGAGGIKIGTQAYTQDESKVAGRNTIKNNLFAHGGRLHPAGVGVWMGGSPFNTIKHNEIVDFYYTGISVGWSWGYGQSNCHNNLIEDNHIHQIGQFVLSDMGGIYLLGLAPGTVVRNNLIHDVNSFDYGGWGIYPDEGSSDLLIEGNVSYDTKSPGYHQHYGKDNLVRDNVFALGREAQVRRSREEDHKSFTFQKNIVFWSNAPLLDGAWSNNRFSFDNNLYWRTDGKPIDFAGMSLEQWRAKGQDANSVIQDPMFVDPARGDFHLKPNSPAKKLGFGLFEKALDNWPLAKRYKGTQPPVFPTKQ